MKLEEVATSALRPATKTFAETHAEAIDTRLGPALDKMDAELRAFGSEPDARVLRKKFIAAETTWEKYFWTRLALHHLGEKLALEEALQRADEDVLSLSFLLHAL